MQTIAVLVNSCRSYCHVTLPPLLDSLREAGVDPRCVFVVVGDSAEASSGMIDEVRVENVVHSNMDDTGLIWAVSDEGQSVLRDFEWIFYVHDTTRVMSDFADRLAHCVPSQTNSMGAKLYHAFSMSMGFYRVTGLVHAREMIVASINHDLSATARLQVKATVEDRVFRLLGCEGALNSVYVSEVVESPYGGVPRIRETWEWPGLHKYKANWGQSHTLHLDL